MPMGGTLTSGMTAGELNSLIQTTGQGSGVVSYPYVYNAQPSTCSPEVHVFPCQRCDTCKCGKATVKREKRGKDAR